VLKNPLLFIYKTVAFNCGGKHKKLKKMNKYRFLGISLLIIGVILMNTIDNV
jgi:uncharacterized membrane protein YdcZ (DUF606 family)